MRDSVTKRWSQSDKIIGTGTLLSDILAFIYLTEIGTSRARHTVPLDRLTISKFFLFNRPPYSVWLVPPLLRSFLMRSSLCLVVAAVPTFAAIKDVFWDITYVDNVSPDGLFDRRAIGVNGTWP